MSAAIARLDEWLRTTFVECNTALEEAYFAAGVEFLDDPSLADAKQAILREGAAHAGVIEALPERTADRYELLGMVGFVLAAARRHETEEDSVLASTWEVACRLGESLGVAPRYVFAHQAFFNQARGGRFRTFTALSDEALFVELNGLGVHLRSGGGGGDAGVGDLHAGVAAGVSSSSPSRRANEHGGGGTDAPSRGTRWVKAG